MIDVEVFSLSDLRPVPPACPDPFAAISAEDCVDDDAGFCAIKNVVKSVTSIMAFWLSFMDVLLGFVYYRTR